MKIINPKTQINYTYALLYSLMLINTLLVKTSLTGQIVAPDTSITISGTAPTTICPNFTGDGDGLQIFTLNTTLDISAFVFDDIVSGAGTEASGLALEPFASNELFTIEDAGSPIRAYSPRFGSLVNTISVPAPALNGDLEGMAYIQDSTYSILDEDDGVVYFGTLSKGVFTITDEAQLTYPSPNESIPMSEASNSFGDGLEGITYDPVSKKMFVIFEYGQVSFGVNELFRTQLFSFPLDSVYQDDGMSKTVSVSEEINQSFGIQDASGLHHLRATNIAYPNSMLMLSEESESIILLNMATHTSSSSLGFADVNIEKAEGIAHGHDYIYIVSEGNPSQYYLFKDTPTLPANGQACIEATGNCLIYTPDSSQPGMDSLLYVVCNSEGECDTGLVRIALAGMASPPTAIDDVWLTNENTDVSIDVLYIGSDDSDAESNVLIVEAGSTQSTVTDNQSSQNGTLTINNNSTPVDSTDDYIEYSPAMDFIGLDTFYYVIIDAEGLTDTAEVIVIVSTSPTPCPTVETEYATWTEDVNNVSGTGFFTLNTDELSNLSNFTWSYSGQEIVFANVDDSEDYEDSQEIVMETLYGEAENESNLRIRALAEDRMPGDLIDRFTITTLNFDRPTPVGTWAFSIIDIEEDQVKISAVDASGSPVPNSTISTWLQQLFDAEVVDGVRSIPTWDVHETALVGALQPTGYTDVFAANISGDQEAAGAWFYPTVSLMSLTLEFNTVVAPANGSAHVHVASCRTEATLPVSLLSFSANEKNRAVTLDWATANELNNHYFDVERSIDGIRYDKIGTISGAGTSAEVNAYTFIDKFPEIGLNYYRLKQVDFDGKNEHSHVVSVNIVNDFDSNHSVNGISVYPIPVTRNVTIELADGIQINSIRVFDISGKEIPTNNTVHSDNSGSDRFSFDMTFLEKGIYLLMVNQTVFKIVKL